ncbi:hypothetical protein CC80DRAFT_418542 [Byssothecium circinans]|uniref:HAD-like protein n=1 Tax=Byssothecium circinans TaxID=147558 RepID=A0A6A5TMQ5_9PLEO|nr:hypothetical protein CC80DRAFT_418542 [Byssothecium circinans]
MPSKSGPIHWILDWDGTITKRDALETLVNIAASNNTHSKILNDWRQVSEAYMRDYENTLKDLLAQNLDKPSTINTERQLLYKIKDVEKRSLDRIYQSKIFAGLRDDMLDKGAAAAMEKGNVQVRDGFSDFMHHIQTRKKYEKRDEFNILSVNWSQRFIAACLEIANISSVQELLPSIHSNELEGIQQNTPSSGLIVPTSQHQDLIVSSVDKISVLNQLRSSRQIPIVYIGDSWTDFECLLSADLGICIRDEPMTSGQQTLADALGRVDVQCTHLEEMGTVDHKGLFWARNFEEIKRWVQRSDSIE